MIYIWWVGFKDAEIDPSVDLKDSEAIYLYYDGCWERIMRDF